MHSAVFKDIHNRLVPALDKLVIPRRIEVVTVPACICKIGEPFPGDESGLVIKKLPVCHLAGRRNDLTPLPGILLRIAGPPEEGRDVLLRGEARHLIGKERQETDFIDPADQLPPGTDPPGIIPVQTLHDPFTAFICH